MNLDLTVVVACSTFFFSVAWLGSAFLWSRVHIKEIEAELHATDLDHGGLLDQVALLQRDVDHLMETAGTVN